MTQLTFSDLPKDDIYDGIAPHIVESFKTYNKENPHIFKLFCKFAQTLKDQGLYHYGSKAIMERIRWHYQVEYYESDFKINNNFSSCFARLLMHQDPTFKEFFKTRTKQELKAA